MAMVLGIESSCDETAAALVEDGWRVVAERVASQGDVFAPWGGVVPEIAARGHLVALPDLVAGVLADAVLAPARLDAVAVTAWPGLIGSLLCGVTAAKVMALRWGKPLLAVDHVEAHLAAVHLGRREVPYPLVGLVASGGHSHYYHCPEPGILEALGGTIDDAAGEAFDKAAGMLGLGYPGGPAIEAAADGGDARRFPLPRSFLRDRSIRLSFAGVKTALLYQVRGPKGRDPLSLDPQGLTAAAASFQEAVVDCLVAKLLQAVENRPVATVAVGGGVACNRRLRERLAEACRERRLVLLLPERRHCQDNAAMVAALGESHLRRGRLADPRLLPVPTGRAGPRAVSGNPG